MNSNGEEVVRSGPVHCHACGQFMGSRHECPAFDRPEPLGGGLAGPVLQSRPGTGSALEPAARVRLGPVVSTATPGLIGSSATPTPPDRVALGLAVLRYHRTGDRTALTEALTARQQHATEMELRQEAAASLPGPEQDRGDDDTAAAGVVPRCATCGQFQGEGHQCPAPEGLPAGDYAGLKGDDRVTAMLGDLESSVKAIVESGQLQRWLDAMSSNGLSRWSANNRLLAMLQMHGRGEPLEDLHLMGFRQWEAFNRNVSKGAKAVWILAPMTRKVEEENDAGEKVTTSRVVGFKGVPVFNISDTHGEPLPSAPVRVPAGQAPPGVLQGLRDRVERAGYTYEEREIPGCDPASGRGTRGYTQRDPKRIVVDARLGDADKAGVIAHELGHVHCGHMDSAPGEYQQHRGRMETEAEMTAYLVTRSRGMSRDQVDAFAPGYIAGWSKGDPKVMHAAVDKATKAFNTIMDGPWPDQERG